jgi:paraquat-inducible protein B
MKKANETKTENHIKEAIHTEKRMRFSTIWIVPITALLIGLVLLFNTWSQRGITVDIRFKSATGIKENKSVVKYKDIEIGKVKKIRFGKDLASVVVTAEINKDMAPYLSEKTRFWIVHAKLTANSVEGLDTLISGAYINMEPHRGNTSVRKFTGLETSPVIDENTKGTRYVLEAENRGSLQPGSPIYYKKIQVGSVISYSLSKDGQSVLIKIFINEPYDKLVKEKTRFWDTSGIYASIGTDGVEIRTESLTALLSGGIAFGNFKHDKNAKKAEEGTKFTLYKDMKSAKQVTYSRELYFWVFFQHSIRGLKAGAPVEFRGIKIGKVVNFSLVGNAETADFEIPVLIKIEPERFSIIGKNDDSEEVNRKVFEKLIDNGLRAQLKSGSLLTGELYVELDFHKDVPKVELSTRDGLYIMPTVPATLETLKNELQTLLNRLSRIPFEEIGDNLNESMKILKEKTLPSITRATDNAGDLLAEGNTSLHGFNSRTLPELNKLLRSTEKAVEEIRNGYTGRNSDFSKRVVRLLDELTATSRSIRNLTDYLERHPESIIRGK